MLPDQDEILNGRLGEVIDAHHRWSLAEDQRLHAVRSAMYRIVSPASLRMTRAFLATKTTW
jgi:hypothetical protein